MSFPGFSDQPGAAERYKYVKALGHGAFGEVVLAEDVQTNQQVAVKQLYLPEPGAPMPQAVARELAALQQVQHPNVIALLDVAVSGCCVYLCQELCCTDLAAVLAAADQQLPPQFVCSIMQQLLAALAACHAAGIMHRDVKPSNILVDKSGSIKLADFGLAKLFAAAGPSQEGAGQQDTSPQCAPTQQHGSIIAHHSVWQQQQQHHHHQQQQHEQGDGPDSPGCHTPAQGTRWYRAPELLFGSRTYGPAVDLWAAGMVFAELLGLTPFLPGQSDIDQLARMQHVLGSITPQAWPAVEQLPDWHKVSFAHSPGQQLSVLLPDAPPIALNLLQQLIRYNPDDRLTAAAALQHAYFACGSS